MPPATSSVISRVTTQVRARLTASGRARLGGLVAAMDRLGWVALVLSAAVCAFTVILSMAVLLPLGRTWDDWLTYVHAAQRLLSGSAIYAPMQLSGPYALPGATLIGYAYPPSSVPFFIPFMSYPVGLVAWLTLNVGLLLTGLYAIVGRELGRVRPIAFALVLLGLAMLRPFYEGVAIGNASVGVAGLLAWCWVIGRAHSSTGFLAGLGATMKVVPGVLLFWSTPQTFPRVFLAALATAAALFAITLPIVGIQSWVDFATALSYSQPACGVDSIPPSVACAIKPIVGVGAAKLAGIALAVVAGGAAVTVRSPLRAFALIVFAWLAPVTDLHSHYLLVVYVLAVVACAAWFGRRSTAGGIGSP